MAARWRLSTGEKQKSAAGCNNPAARRQQRTATKPVATAASITPIQRPAALVDQAIAEAPLRRGQ